LNVLNAEIDAATVDFSRGVVGLAINEANRATKDQEDLSWNIVASLGGTAKSLERSFPWLQMPWINDNTILASA